MIHCTCTYMQGRERPNPTRPCIHARTPLRPLAWWILVTQPASFFLARPAGSVLETIPFDRSSSPWWHVLPGNETIYSPTLVHTQSCASRDTWTSLSSADRQTGRHFKPLNSFYTYWTLVHLPRDVRRLPASWPYYWSLFSCLRSERTRLDWSRPP
jgi:hypothetical protein